MGTSATSPIEPSEDQDPARLAIVVVSYECRDLLEQCLESLREHASIDGEPADVWVVDNGSTDRTQEMVRSRFPDVRFRPTGANLGFSVANNLALRGLGSEYVLILNPDTVIHEGTLPRLVELMDERSEIGMAGCRLIKPDGSFDHAAKRSFPTITGALGHFLRVGRAEGAPWILAQYRAPELGGAGPVDALTGAFMLIRRAALDEVGLFDEGYWLYMEDLDLCYRFAQHGWVVWYEASVSTTHVKHGTSGKALPLRQNRAFHYGMYRFYRKFYAPQRLAVINAAVYAGIVGKLAVAMARSSLIRAAPALRTPPGLTTPVPARAPEAARRAAILPRAARPDERLELSTARVAIVHDWFQGFHGSERVVEVMLSDVFHDARAVDIFTFHAAPELLPQSLAHAIVRQSRLSRLPGIRQRGHDPGRWRYLLPYMPFYFSRLRLDDYDIVVSSSHACAVHARPRSGALHVCYCYTPMRYAWMPATDAHRGAGLTGTALRALSRWLRDLDASAAARVDAYVTLSTAVRDRIRSFYGRDAEVIHAPVEVDEFDPDSPKEPGHFLWVHRLVPYKRPEVVLEAFRGLPYRLTMVGVGPQEERLRERLPPNVELVGWMSRDELAALYGRCSGFLHVGEEDFGISMVEALAAGMPVIALNRGGARDIVRPGIDGVLIDDATVDGIRAAVTEVAGSTWEPSALARRAQTFSRQDFTNRFRAHLNALLS